MAIGFLIIFVLLNKIIMRIKTILAGLSLLFLLSCVNQQNTNKPVKTKIEKSHKRHLRKQLASFIKGMRKGKPDGVKAYFDFPIKNDNFWYVTLEYEKWEEYKGKGFGEKEFQIYFDAIFMGDFRETLGRINVNRLLKQGYDKAEYSYDSWNGGFKDILEVTYTGDKITMTFNTVVYSSGGGGEHIYVYVFTTKDGVLKFKDFQSTMVH